MTVEQTNDSLIIKLAKDTKLSVEELQSLINCLRIKELTSNSLATDSDIESLVEDFKQNWWTNNKSRFLPDAE